MPELSDAEINARTIGLVALIFEQIRRGKDLTSSDLDPMFAILNEGMNDYRFTVEVRTGSQQELVDSIHAAANAAAKQQLERSQVVIAKLISMFCELGVAAEQATGPLDVSEIIREHALWDAGNRHQRDDG